MPDDLSPTTINPAKFLTAALWSAVVVVGLLALVGWLMAQALRS